MRYLTAWKIFGVILLFTVGNAVIFVYFFLPEGVTGCNVNGYTLYGEMVTSRAYTAPASSQDEEGEYERGHTVTISDAILTGIEKSEKDNTIKAIILEIDSPGGQPVAGEEVAIALRRFSKPTVAVIRTSGTSAAYWAATGADTIFASKNSDVGGIGISYSLVNNLEKNHKEGVEYVNITSAPFKSLGDPNRPLTLEEKSILQQTVDEVHKNFLDAVSENRTLDRAAVETLANGYPVLGTHALEQGLIDRIGNLHDAEVYLEEEFGIIPSICWN